MRRRMFLCAALATSAVHASMPADVMSTCTGALTEVWGDSITLSCTGDLALTGLTPEARLEAIDSITLSADGSLSINNLTLHALNISLWGGQSFAMSDTVHLEHAGSFEWVPGHLTISSDLPRFFVDRQWGELDIQSGAIISLSQPQTSNLQRLTGGELVWRDGGIVTLNNTAGVTLAVAHALTVPEPTMWALTLAGALVVVGRRR